MTTLSSSRRSWVNFCAAVLGISGFCLAASSADQSASPAIPGANEFRGNTAPSEKRVQNFDLPGVIHKMYVKEGDVVKAGQLLAEQNIAPDEAHLRSLEIVAKSSVLETKADEAELELDAVDLNRKTDLYKVKHAISPSEFEQAQLKVKVDGLKVDHARSEEEHTAVDVLEQKARIEQKKLFARIDGIVSEITVHEGEVATTNNDPQRPGVLTIVKNDPLYVEVEIDSKVVKQLKSDWKNKILQVQYDDDPGVWHNAKIHFIKPEADPRSNTEHVQLEMPNPEGRSSGLMVTVRIPTGNTAAEAASTANIGH
jgi:RND family efflux transporter MFP subunit